MFQKKKKFKNTLSSSKSKIAVLNIYIFVNNWNMILGERRTNIFFDDLRLINFIKTKLKSKINHARYEKYKI